MKRQWLRISSLLLAGAMTVGLAACGQTGSTTATTAAATAAQTTTAKAADGATTAAATEAAADDKASAYAKIKWIMPGEENATWKAFIDNELNPKLKSEINAELEITYSPWSEYFTKIDLVMTSGQELDIAWHGPAGVQSWYAKKAILPIDDLLAKYGTDLTASNPTEKWKHVTIDGKIMAIPVNSPTSENFGTLCVRQDLLEKVGMTDLKTVEDVTAFAEKLKAQGLSDNPFVATSFKPYLRAADHSLSVDLGFLSNWFYVDEDEAGDTVYSYFASDAFKQFCALTADWNAKKLIPEDFLTNTDELGRMNTGKSAIWTGAITRDMEQQAGLTANVPEGVYNEYLLYPDKPKYIITGGGNVFVFPATSKTPEKTMQFLNWVYKSQENYDFMVLGTKGAHYDLDANNRVKTLATESMFYEWMFRNVKYMRFPDTVSDETIKRITTWDDDAKYSKLFGFNFDQTPVKAEIARVQSVITEKLTPIMYGFMSYDENIKDALDELNAAGMDKVQAELQKQFSAWYATQK